MQSILTPSHSEFVWKGESEIASITSTAGIYRHDMDLPNLFDDNADSFWHRSNDYVGIAELIIEFQTPINFLRLILRKRQEGSNRYYENVCLRIGYLLRNSSLFILKYVTWAI